MKVLDNGNLPRLLSNDVRRGVAALDDAITQPCGNPRSTRHCGTTNQNHPRESRSVKALGRADNGKKRFVLRLELTGICFFDTGSYKYNRYESEGGREGQPSAGAKANRRTQKAAQHAKPPHLHSSTYWPHFTICKQDDEELLGNPLEWLSARHISRQPSPRAGRKQEGSPG